MEVFFGITGHYLVTVVQVLQIFFIVGECPHIPQTMLFLCLVKPPGSRD